MSEYTEVCVLKRCGQLYGNPDCCKKIEDITTMQYWDEELKDYIKIEVNLKDTVLASIWKQIEHESCAQYLDGVCITRRNCYKKQSYCYPIPLRKKKINKIVAVMFAYYCADIDAYAYVAADAAAAYAYVAADAAAAAAYVYVSASAAADDREEFYRDAAEELIRLIDAWGTPIKEEE